MDVEKLLEDLGIPFAYQKFKPYKNIPLPDPPYIKWFIDDEHHFGSDDKNLLKRCTITIELYTKNRDKGIETKIEKALGFGEFDIWREYLENEKLHVTLYEFETITKIGGLKDV